MWQTDLIMFKIIKKMKRDFLFGFTFLVIFVLVIFTLRSCDNRRRTNTVEEEVPQETFIWRYGHYELNNRNVYQELVAQNIDYPEIVLAQAILETGHYQSYSCTHRHNLFGLRRRDGSYMEFDHWTGSVAAYKKYIQKYQTIPEDYYKFLDDLGYAEDSIYVIRVRQVVKTMLGDYNK